MTPISERKRCGTSWNTEPLPMPSASMPTTNSASAIQACGWWKLASASAIAATSFVVVSLGLPSIWLALAAFSIGMLALGMGNGAVFQLVPQRFAREIGIMTGLVGMAGGLGGFYLASSLGYSKKLTGSYEIGFLIYALIAAVAFIGITTVRRRWRTTWASDALVRV